MRLSERRCSRPGCERWHYAKGYCSMHYWRSRNGTAMDLPPRGEYDRLCTFPGCDRRHSHRGYCDTHAQQLKRHGGEVSKLKPIGWRQGNDRIDIRPRVSDDAHTILRDEARRFGVSVGELVGDILDAWCEQRSRKKSRGRAA